MAKRTILLIDDDPIFVRGMKKNLQLAGYNVIDAYDGITGLNLAQKHRPDLIILDAMMPILDGFKVCTKLKENPETSGIKVLMLTGAISTPEEEEKGKALATDFVIKGGRVAVLLDRISKLLSHQ